MKTHKELKIDERQRYNLIKMGLWLNKNKERLKPNFVMSDFAGAHVKHEDPEDEYPDEPYLNTSLEPSQLFSTDGLYQVPNECGTNCCVIGHAINPNIELKEGLPWSRLRKMRWCDIGADLFGYDTADPRTRFERCAWDFLFAADHVADPEAAAKRIFWFLEHGVGIQSAKDNDEVHVPPGYTTDYKMCEDGTKYENGATYMFIHENYIRDPGHKWSMDIPKWEEELKKAEEALEGPKNHENA
jgi:hypothetical protein